MINQLFMDIFQKRFKIDISICEWHIGRNRATINVTYESSIDVSLSPEFFLKINVAFSNDIFVSSLLLFSNICLLKHIIAMYLSLLGYKTGWLLIHEWRMAVKLLLGRKCHNNWLIDGTKRSLLEYQNR